MKNFLYDASFEGLLTTLFYCYKIQEPLSITKEKDYIYNLFSDPIIIKTEADKAKRVYESIYHKLSSHTLSNVYHLYLSDTPDSEKLALDYIRLCFLKGDRINAAKNNDIIRKTELIVQRVLREAERFYGFIRFKEIMPYTFYAVIEPDHNILPLLIKHFVTRFNDQRFMIHDLKRRLALVYTKDDFFIQKLSAEESSKLTQRHFKDPFEAFFKTYYKASTIPERINEKRRRSYMPARYFKHLIEL